MIKSLAYTVKFKQTGRTLSADLSFASGVTAIVGPNEAGKSFVVEMMRYAFFGSAALRGVGDDYEILKVKMTFKDYVIDRNLKGGTIATDGAVLATGTKGLNAKVIEILGFGLDVFDVSCVCNQGDVERLGAMPASERKAMVDRVIGVAKIETVQKWAAEQQTLLGREIEVLERGLSEPVEPVLPVGYGEVDYLSSLVAHRRGAKQEHDELVGWLSHARSAPGFPVPVMEQATEEELVIARTYDNEVGRIKALPVVDFDVDEVDRWWWDWDQWTALQRFTTAHPVPECTWAEYLQEQLALENYAKLSRLNATRRQHLKHGTVTCPECTHEFPLAHSVIDDIDRQISEIHLTHTPTRDEAWLRAQHQRLVDWDDAKTKTEWERVKGAEPAVEPTVTRHQLAQAKLGGGVTSAQRQTMLFALTSPARPSRIIQEVLDAHRRYELALAQALKEQASYDAWRAERVEKEERRDKLRPLVESLPATEQQLRVSETYDRDLTRFQLDRAAYETRLNEVKEKQAELEGWRSARGALADVRLRVKTYLVPSLSRVASHLLSQMTAGQRTSLVVDENFDVMVDGQRLETLSGSGKAVANLALRIGLGQVLTNKVVSLFVGDEIDASMDPVRANATHSSIRRLRDRILQIILITHKIPEADTVISLGTSSGNS